MLHTPPHWFYRSSRVIDDGWINSVSLCILCFYCVLVVVKVFSCYNEDRVEIHLISVKVLQSKCTNLLILQSVKFIWLGYYYYYRCINVQVSFKCWRLSWFIYLLKCRAETWGQLTSETAHHTAIRASPSKFNLNHQPAFPASNDPGFSSPVFL